LTSFAFDWSVREHLFKHVVLQYGRRTDAKSPFLIPVSFRRSGSNATHQLDPARSTGA